MVKRHAVGGTTAAIMTHDMEAIETHIFITAT